MTSERSSGRGPEQWGSRLGFILASAGAAALILAVMLSGLRAL